MLRPLRPKLILLRAFVVVGTGYALTSVWPARFDSRLSRSITWTYLETHPRMIRVLAGRMRDRLVPFGVEAEFNRLARANIAMRLEEDLGRIRGMHRRGWKPDIELEGIEHLEAALADGHGAILWRMSFTSSPVTKVALAESGYPLVHLSSPRHGWARWHGRLGRRLPQLHNMAENRFLKERVLVQDAGLEYLRVLLARLEENEVVSIFGDTGAGKRDVKMSFLGRTRNFASGAPSLARRSGCALLTVHTVWLGPQRYRVVIEEPIEIDSSMARHRLISLALEEYIERLERHIIENPASWRGWHTRGITPESSTVTAGGTSG